MQVPRIYAHSGSEADRSDWQLLPDHLESVEHLARERGSLMGLGELAAIAGRLHDLGKYDPEFDRVLSGESLRVDHSTAGGKALLDRAPDAHRPTAEVLAYAILGHHAGLPDKTSGSDACLDRRIARFGARLAEGWQDHLPADLRPASAELAEHMRAGKAAFDLSVAVRMAFSCLVDADFRDTEAYYGRIDGSARDREWPALQTILPGLHARFDAHMAEFDRSSELNSLRASILSHVRARSHLPPGLFTLSVPTGGGKTLASLGFALDHARRHGHRRIIYAIPYTSIIDQTAKIFREILGGEHVLEHHSSIDTTEGGEQGRAKARLAMEDWGAPVVVTTNVQLFESLFAARPSRCRKLHNIAGAVIVLDEAQCLPRHLLFPTLAMLDTLAARYGCTIVLCTATQPAFDSGKLRTGGLPLEGRELAPDLQGLTEKLRRVRIVPGSTMDDSALVDALAGTSQGFIIVNSRKHALDIYQRAREANPDGLIHLTTRQYPAHRRQIIADIRDRLSFGAPCRLIATSLIEAGVDLDFPCGWRAEAGLDSVIQAAGRVNREGRKPLNGATLTVFTAPDNPPFGEVAKLASAMQATAHKFDDLFSPEAIRHWFEEVYWRAGDKALGADLANAMVLGRTGTNFPFRTAAEVYRMIESQMVPVIVMREKTAQTEVARLAVPELSSAPIARALQAFTVQIPAKARDALLTNGKGAFASPELRGDQFFVLSDTSLYREDIGLWWENADYLDADQLVI